MLSKKALSLKPSPTLQLVARARELAQQGHDVISLSVGEPDWPTFAAPTEVGIKAIKDGFSKYTAANGIPELREAIVKQIKKEQGFDYTATQVTVGSGAKFVLFAAFQMLCDEQDEVIIPAPYWVSYPVMVELAQGVPRVIECGVNENFKITPEKLEKAITPKTKAFVFSSPSNPTGLAYTKDELKALAEVFRKHPRIVIISDDIYNHLMLNGTKLAPHILEVAPDLKSRTLIVNGVSKSYAMTGWRIGWAIGPAELIKVMADYQSQSTSSACSFSQKAALEAINSCDKDIELANEKLHSRLSSAINAFEKLPFVKVHKPDGAFYIWLDVSKTFGKSYDDLIIKSSREFATVFLDKYHVATVPGVEFGTEGFIRLSFAIETPRMLEAINRMASLIAKLK
jgi:aspartate aminotransferase